MANGLSPETIAMLVQAGKLPPDAQTRQNQIADQAYQALLQRKAAEKARHDALMAQPTSDASPDPMSGEMLLAGGAPPPAAAPLPAPVPAGQPSQPTGPVDAIFAKPPAAAGGAASMPGGMAPAQVVPAHEGRAVSPQTESMLEGAEKEKEQAANERMGAAEQGEKAEIGANEATARSLGMVSGQALADQAQSQKKADAWQKALDVQQAEYEAMNKEAASGKPDYGRFMRSKGVLGQVAASIAVGLSAAGAALTHTGGNTALEIINRSIDRDIEEQRDELSQKQASAKAKGVGLAAMHARFQDWRAADQAERAKLLEVYKLKGDQMVAEANSPAIAARWANTRAGLNDQQAEIHKQWAMEHQAMHPWQQASIAGGAGGGGINAGVTDVGPDEVLRLNDGRYVAIADKGAREKATEFISKADQVHQGAQDIQRLLSMPLAERARNPLAWQRQFHAASEQLSMAEMLGGGKGGIGATKANMQAIGHGNFLWNPGIAKTVQTLDTNAQRLAREHIAHSGGRIVEPTMVPNAKKNVMERKFLDRGQLQLEPQEGAGGPTVRPPGG